MLVTVCLALIALHLLVILLGTFIIARSEEAVPAAEGPLVSILIAARNEERSLPRLLRSLKRLDYPAARLDILIGDDHSEDNTASLARTFCKKRPHARLIQVRDNLGAARGKSNVLAHLAREARGDVFLITDADMEVSPGWVQAHLGALKGKTAVSSGTTLIRHSNLWTSMQHLESVYLMGVYHAVDRVHPVTAMGNNMAVTREAYLATGGYESMPFSLIEDFQLMQAAKAKGYLHRQLLQQEAIGWTLPLPGLSAFLRQRRRWMAGIAAQPWYMWLLFALYGLYLPVLVLLLVLHIKAAALVFMLKTVIDFWYLQMIYSRLRLTWNPAYLPVFELYLMCLNLMMTLNSFTSRKIVWKGRVYE